MAAGTVTVLGPYTVGDSATIATALSTEAGAIIKSITSWQDQSNKFVYFCVCTEA